MRRVIIVLELLAVLVGGWPVLCYIIMRFQGTVPDPSLRYQLTQFHGPWFATGLGDWILASRWVGIALLILTLVSAVLAVRAKEPKSARLGWLAAASQVVMTALVWSATEWLIS